MVNEKALHYALVYSRKQWDIKKRIALFWPGWGQVPSHFNTITLAQSLNIKKKRDWQSSWHPSCWKSKSSFLNTLQSSVFLYSLLDYSLFRPWLPHWEYCQQHCLPARQTCVHWGVVRLDRREDQREMPQTTLFTVSWKKHSDGQE